MRTYGQYCAVAKALDVVGDRWALLIVRELLLRGACRYTDLRYGLPGIATNLLAQRLRELEEAGVVRREDAPPPVATTLFHLTDRGHELAPVITALGRWGVALMAEPHGDETFRSHWLVFPAEQLLVDADPEGPPVTVQVSTGDQPIVLETIGGAVRARPGTVEDPDVVLSGAPALVLGVLTGMVGLREAKRGGLRAEGDTAVLRRLRAREHAA